MMAKKYKWLLGILIIIILIATRVVYYFGSSHKTSKVEGIAEFDSLASKAPFTKITVKPFKHVIVNCELGPVKVQIVADKKPSVEFHRTFMKYTEMSYRGDTLEIRTKKTPKSTEENPIIREMYLYTPDIQYYRGEATQTFISNFITSGLTINNRSSYIRLINCEIENLKLSTNKSCNFVIDKSCFFNRVDAVINPSSAFTCLARVQTELLVTAKKLDRITLDQQNARKFRLKKWTK